MFSTSIFQPTRNNAIWRKLISSAIILLSIFTSVNIVHGQFSLNRIIISEVTLSGEIEIFNPTSNSVNIGNYWLCNFPSYTQISNLNLDSGSLQLAPGETAVVSNFNGFDAVDGELGLYSTNSFGSSSAITSYVEYGSSGHVRSSVAVNAGIWMANSFLPAPTGAGSIQAQGAPPSTLTYTNLAPTVGTPDPSLLNSPVTVDGGAISLVSGATDTVICIDGVASPFDVVRDGNSSGTNRDFVITDDAGNILALPPHNGPFDLEGAGVGTCEIWYLAYENGLQNLATGNNLSDLVGTFDLSNAITVVRQSPDGGVVTLVGGATDYIGCAGEIVFDVEHTTAATSLSYWYIITDDSNNILGFANSANTSTLDLSGAPTGTCRIWGWSYRGLGDPIVGENISTLTDDACEAISDDYITVYREVPDGGTVTLVGGATDTVVTAGNAMVNVEHTTTGGFLSYWYIITDENNDILGFANSANTSTLDLSGAPAGTCRIWGWSYRGLGDPNIGDDIVTLTDDFCEAISDDFITVVRQAAQVDGGAIALVSGATDTVICIDGVASPFDVVRDGNSSGTNRDFVITDDAGNILALPPHNGPFDLEGAGVGTCEIWYLAYENGLQNLATGNNLSDLVGTFDLSNAITVVRQSPDGGVVTLVGGATDYIGCAGEIVFDVEHSTAATSLSYWYIITDDSNNILGFANSANTSTLDLSGAPAGTCRVWGWSYRGLSDPIVGDNISTLTDDACEAISDDFITVYREVPDGGTVTLVGGATDTVVTAGNAFVNVEHTTTGGFLSYWYIITDDNDDILGFANSANTSTLDLSGAPAGTCRIWGWSYRGLDDPIVGESIMTLMDDFCEAVSAEYITVVREDPNGGPNTDMTIALNEVGVNGWIEIINNTDQAADISNYWVCNRPAYAALNTLNIECGDLNLEPGEIVVVSGFSGLDVVDGELALYNTNSFGSATAIVSYLEWGSTGHGRSSVAISAGLWTADRFLPAPTATQSLQRALEEVNGESFFALTEPTFCAVNAGVSSTQSFAELEGVSIFPNPTSNFSVVSIEGNDNQDVEIRLFNSTGQLISARSEFGTNVSSQLDLATMPSGTYTVQVISGNAATTRRVVKR